MNNSYNYYKGLREKLRSGKPQTFEERMDALDSKGHSPFYYDELQDLEYIPPDRPEPVILETKLVKKLRKKVVKDVRQLELNFEVSNV